MKNLQNKTRPLDNPYEIWKATTQVHGEILHFEWRVLRKYQTPKNEAMNKRAIWYVAGRSEATFGSWEYGDMYIQEIKDMGGIKQ